MKTPTLTSLAAPVERSAVAAVSTIGALWRLAWSWLELLLSLRIGTTAWHLPTIKRSGHVLVARDSSCGGPGE